MMIRLVALVALFTASTLAIGAAPNAVYKWKDASGEVHYSDAPPPQGITYTKVKAGISSVGSSDTPPPVDPAAAAATDPAATTTAKQTTAQANAKLCEQARANVKLLQGEGPLMIQRDGKQEALPDTNRAGELKRAQAAATLYCA